MCTAINIKKYKNYFGRTLDLEYNYNEQMIVIPRKYNLKYRYNKSNNEHYSFFGIGIIENNYPLLYDGCNEHGLCIAGLNLPNSTTYCEYKSNKVNICSFELIPFVLSTCGDVYEAKKLLTKINITNDSFNNYYSTSKLHFIISDENSSLVLEVINKKIIIYDNPYGVLTNEPSFDFHLKNIKHYDYIDNIVKNNIKGSQLIGLPGDNLSASRFIRATLNKKYIIFNENNISEIFNIFNNVYEINGLAKINENSYYKTIYMVIYNTIDKILYLKTYMNSQIISIKLSNYDLNTDKLINYSIYFKENIIVL